MTNLNTQENVSTEPETLADRLKRIKESRRGIEYTEIEAEKALRICVAIYIKDRSHLYVNYMEGMKVLLADWFIHYKGQLTNSSKLLSYPSEDFPDVCICGTQLGYSGMNLRYHCMFCKGKITRFCASKYEIQEIASYTQLSIPVIESIFAKVIYYGY